MVTSPSTANYHSTCRELSLKGMLRFAGRHLGNSPRFQFEVREDGSKWVHFDLDEITVDNVRLFVNRGVGRLVFEPKNEFGPLVAFESAVELVGGEFDIIHDQWSTLRYHARIIGAETWSIADQPETPKPELVRG